MPPSDDTRRMACCHGSPLAGSLHATLHSPLHHRPLTLCQRAVKNKRTGSGEVEPVLESVLEPPERSTEAGEPAIARVTFS